MNILTPTGYKSVNELAVGDDVSAFDINTGAPIVNQIENIQFLSDDLGSFYTINGEYTYYGEQSIWANDNVTHVKLLQVGDTLYDDHDAPFTITSIDVVTNNGWVRFEVSGDHSYIADGVTLHNASRFWILGTGGWTTINIINWSSSSGGTGGASVPGSADTATFDANSGGGTVTPNYSMTVTSITMGAFTGTLDFSANNNSPTLVTFSNTGTGTRTLNGGTGTWTITGNNATVWNMGTVTNLTFNFSGATLNFTYSGSTGTRTFAVGGVTMTYGVINFSAGSDTISMNNGLVTTGNFSSSGFSGIFNKGAQALTIGGNFTLGTGSTWTSTGGNFTMNGNGSFTFTSNGVAFNQSIILNNVNSTFTLGSNLDMSGSVTANHTLSNGTFVTNNFSLKCGSLVGTGTGTKTWTLGTSTITLIGTSTNVINVSGGTIVFSGASSTINITGASASINGTITYGTVTFTGGGVTAFGGAATFGALSWIGTGSSDAITLNQNQIVNGTCTITGNGSSKTTIASNVAGTLRSITFGSAAFSNIASWTDISLTQNASGGTWTLTEDLNLASASAFPIITITQGTFDTGASNYAVTTGNFFSTGAVSRTVNMNGSLFTIYGTGTCWSVTNSATINPGTATIKFTNTGNSTVGFNSGGNNKTHHIVWFARGTSTGVNQIGNASNIDILKDDGTVFHQLTIIAGITIQINTSWLVSGTPGNRITMNSSTTGTYNIVNNTGTNISADWLNIQQAVVTPVTPGILFFAGRNSVNNQNVASAGSGIVFDEPGHIGDYFFVNK